MAALAAALLTAGLLSDAYDGQGQVQEDGRVVYTFNDSNSTVTLNQDGTLTINTLCNDGDNVISSYESTYDADGNETVDMKFYDDAGNVTSETIYKKDPDGHILWQDEITIDSQGNKKITYRQLAADGSLVSEFTVQVGSDSTQGPDSSVKNVFDDFSRYPQHIDPGFLFWNEFDDELCK